MAWNTDSLFTEVLEEFVGSIVQFQYKEKDPGKEYSDVDALGDFGIITARTIGDKLGSFYSWKYAHSEKGKARRRENARARRARLKKETKKDASSKVCGAEYLKSYYNDKKEAINQKRRERYAKNKDEMNKKQKEYRAKKRSAQDGHSA